MITPFDAYPQIAIRVFLITIQLLLFASNYIFARGSEYAYSLLYGPDPALTKCAEFSQYAFLFFGIAAIIICIFFLLPRGRQMTILWSHVGFILGAEITLLQIITWGYLSPFAYTSTLGP